MSPQRTRKEVIDTHPKNGRDPFARSATSSRSRQSIPRIRELHARRKIPSPAQSDKGNLSFGGKSEFERRETGKNRKGPPRHTDSIACRERPDCQHRQLSAHRVVQSASRSDSGLRIFGQNSGILAEISLCAQNCRSRYSYAGAQQVILSAAAVRIERSIPHVGATRGSGVVAKRLIFRSEKPKFSVFDENGHGRYSPAVEQSGILPSSLVRIDRYVLHFNPTIGSEVVQDLLAKIVDFWPKFHSLPKTVTAVARTH